MIRNKNTQTTPVLSLSETARVQGALLPTSIDLPTGIIASTKPRELDTMLTGAMAAGVAAQPGLLAAQYGVSYAEIGHEMAVDDAATERQRAVDRADFSRRSMADLGTRLLDDIAALSQQTGAARPANFEAQLASGKETVRQDVVAKIDNYQQQADRPAISDEALEKIHREHRKIDAAKVRLTEVEDVTRAPMENTKLAKEVEQRQDALGRRDRIATRVAGVMLGLAVIGVGAKIGYDISHPQRQEATGIFDTPQPNANEDYVPEAVTAAGVLAGSGLGYATSSLARPIGKQSARRRAQRAVRKAKG